MNRYIFSILSLFILLDVFVFVRMFMLLSSVRSRRMWRLILSILALSAIGFCVAAMIANPVLGGTRDPFPRWFVGSLYIWQFLMLPPLFAVLAIDLLIRVVRRISMYQPVSAASPPPLPPDAPMLSRRNFLTSLGVSAVPAATISLAGIALMQIGKFRIMHYDLSLAGWPRELDGYKITVVADVHAGAFSTQKMLDDIAAASNRLKSDLIFLAGDLINIDHHDLPAALDMVLKMQAPDGVYMIQGNHDVVQGPDRFNHAVRRRGVNLLVDQSAIIVPKRNPAPFQLLGTRWTDQNYRDISVSYTASLRDPNLFAIMLAHHPHSWDMAAASGIPLVISGHTHGGQIMLTKNIGGGPLRFKYWSGRYDSPHSTLIVSNGVGNWFPLRVNAPAEILQITIHPGTAAEKQS